VSETIQNKKIFSLLEVTRSIQKTLEQRYTSDFWVKAEMIKLNHYSHSGHCYPDLVEKQQGKVIAQIRSNLWKRDFQRINHNFLQVLKEPLKDGIKILFLARISFDPIYGISLHILDIDPSFTLGDLEKEKQETIEKLLREGLFAKNKSTVLELLPQRLAIISVETSKGYADFISVIDNNPWGYKFFHLLFPSILQGEKAIDGIIFQLNRIRKVISHFDLVAIIRGGGGDVGLSCYNDYRLCKTIADFPLPVITGIGHATNETVAEMVGFENAITPTKLAEFLIQHFHNFAEPVNRARIFVTEKTKQLMLDEKQKIKSEVKLFRSATQSILNTNQNDIFSHKQTLLQHTVYIFKSQHSEIFNLKTKAITGSKIMLKNKLEKTTWLFQKLIDKVHQHLQNKNLAIQNLEKNIEILNPQNVLKRGFSITRINGKAIKSIEQVAEGEMIDTTVFNGKIISIVKSKKLKQ